VTQGAAVGDCGIPDGGLLIEFAEAILGGNKARLARALEKRSSTARSHVAQQHAYFSSNFCPLRSTMDDLDSDIRLAAFSQRGRGPTTQGDAEMMDDRFEPSVSQRRLCASCDNRRGRRHRGSG
jgi:hypothetical protein